MLLASAATGVRRRNIASFPAIRTVVETVGAHVHVVLPFADRAVLFARTARFRHVAHRATDGTGHGSLQGKLYLSVVSAARRAFSRCSQFRTCWLTVKLALSTLHSADFLPQVGLL